MNFDFFSDEFRSFKLLKLSSEFATYFKRVGASINSVRPESELDNSKFAWPFRVEFVEQIFSLSDSTLYIVDTGDLELSLNMYGTAALHVVDRPVMYEGTMFTPDLGRLLTIEDADSIEHNRISENKFLLCSEDFRNNRVAYSRKEFEMNIFSVHGLPVVPKKDVGYTALFYDFMWAALYKDTVTRELRKRKEAVSAITRLFRS